MAIFAIAPIVIATAVVLVFRFMNQHYNPPILGIYQQSNKYSWLKFVLMYFILRARQLYIHLKGLLAVELGYSYDGTVHIHEQDVALEQMFNLDEYYRMRDTEFCQSVDAVYFNGAAKDGVAVICGVARRPENYCDAFMYLKVNGEDLLLSPELPETRLKQESTEDQQYRAGGINLSNVIPMRTWKVHYNGEMKYKNDYEKKVKVQMDLTWSANWNAFNFDHQISPLTMAKDLAREAWSADYFNLLKKLHQTHYEQMGFLTGIVYVDGQEHAINMPCVRDHSFGNHREWRNFHRYVLHFIYMENGDCMAIGAVSQPVIISHLTIGYLCRNSDQAVLPVKASDFQLWLHGEKQNLPTDYGFSFKAGGQRYDVQIQVNEEDYFYIGKEREAKIHERWATVEVNGVKGWGCLEWQYNNVAAAS